MFENILKNVSYKSPIIHFITNKVTINDCANVTLAVGGRPIMADDKNEVADITAGCSALVLNIGTLSKERIPSMIKALKVSNECHHPVVLDPVGIGASQLRKETVFQLLEGHIDVIKGNVSEIKVILDRQQEAHGVDANEDDVINEDNMDEYIQKVQKICKQLQTIIVVTGKQDLVIGEEGAYVIHNGCAMMSKITGTGCMLNGILGTFIASNPEQKLEAVAYAVAMMGYCGEKAYEKMKEEKRGLGSMHMFLIDALSLFDENWEEGLKIEKR